MTEYFIVMDIHERLNYVHVYGQRSRCKTASFDNLESVLEDTNTQGRGLVGWRNETVAKKHLERKMKWFAASNPRIVSLFVNN